MNTATSSLGDRLSAFARASSSASPALLGLFIVGFAGFSHMEVVHNAGHDYRHSMAFPCH